MSDFCGNTILDGARGNSEGYNEKLDEHFSRPFKEFVALCLKKLPAERPSARELLKNRFIRNARKSPKLLERIRERPKYQPPEDGESPTIARGLTEGSDTVKVKRDVRKKPSKQVIKEE